MLDVTEQVIEKTEAKTEDWFKFLTSDNGEGLRFFFDFAGDFRWNEPSYIGSDLACYAVPVEDNDCLAVRVLEGSHGHRVKKTLEAYDGVDDLRIVPEPCNDREDCVLMTFVIHDPKDVACVQPYGFMTVGVRFVHENWILADAGEEQDAAPNQNCLFVRMDAAYLLPERRNNEISLRFTHALEHALFSGFEAINRQGVKLDVAPEVNVFMTADFITEAGEAFCNYAALAVEYVQECLDNDAKDKGKPSPFPKAPLIDMGW